MPKLLEVFLHYEHPLAPKDAEALMHDLIWANRLEEAKDLALSMVDHFGRRAVSEDEFERQDRRRTWAIWLGSATVLTTIVNSRSQRRYNKRKKPA